MTDSIVVKVPELGDFKDVEVIDVLVKAGDAIELETPLITLETDKATMDVPSTAQGKVTAVHVERGARVNVGDRVVTVEGQAAAGQAAMAPAAAPAAAATAATATAATDAAAAAPAAQAAAPPKPAPAAAAPSPTAGPAPVEESGFSLAHASPSVRQFARELGVDLLRVRGSGLKGRVTRDDVKAWVKGALASGTSVPGAAWPAVPEVDFAAFGPVEVRPLGRIQKIAGPRLHASWVNVPHVTQHDEADITELEELRAGLKERATQAGIKLTPLAFIMRACARVLARYPEFGASLDATGQNLIVKKYIHIGFAADTPGGLMVPVVRDADRKDVYEVARDLQQLSERARAGRLAAADMQGGCFTVSSLGGIGGTAFTPIINAPEVAILGVSRARKTPVWTNGHFVARTLLPLSLSYDHRVIDGAAAVRFTTALGEALAQPRTLLEAVP